MNGRLFEYEDKNYIDVACKINMKEEPFSRCTFHIFTNQLK
jgi:hypothetical protein